VSKRQDLRLESGLRTEHREHCRKEQTQDAQHRVSQSAQGFGKPNDLRKIEVSENHNQQLSDFLREEVDRLVDEHVAKGKAVFDATWAFLDIAAEAHQKLRAAKS